MADSLSDKPLRQAGALRHTGRLVKAGGWQDPKDEEYVRAEDYEALRLRFEKACAEITRLESRSSTRLMTPAERTEAIDAAYDAWLLKADPQQIFVTSHGFARSAWMDAHCGAGVAPVSAIEPTEAEALGLERCVTQFRGREVVYYVMAAADGRVAT